MRGLVGNASCSSMPWDAWPERPSTNESDPIRAVIVSHQRGGTGNKLFAIAAGIALSEALRLPLLFPPKVSQTMAARGFPCLRTSRAIRGVQRGRLQLVQPNMLFGINFQDVAVWGTPEPSPRPPRPTTAMWLDVMRRAFRPTAGSFHLAAPPAEDDLVLHFRDLRDCNNWRAATAAERQVAQVARLPSSTRSTYRAANAASRWFYDLDLYAPPPAFYDAAIEAHLARWPSATVWVACMPCDRGHPTLVAIAARWQSRLRFLTAHGTLKICDRVPSCKVPPILDFLWMQAARHVVLSPSTFGWWSAFLSERAATIHYPVLPTFSPWGPTMWCHLLPEDDARYVFHDPWGRARWHGGSRTGHGARRRCDVYMRACLQAHACAVSEESAAAARKALPLDGIDEFVTYVDEGHELEGLTSAQLEAAARRHNVSVGIDGGRGQLLRAIAGSPAAVLARKEARAYLSGVNRAPPQRRGN